MIDEADQVAFPPGPDETATGDGGPAAGRYGAPNVGNGTRASGNGNPNSEDLTPDSGEGTLAGEPGGDAAGYCPGTCRAPVTGWTGVDGHWGDAVDRTLRGG